MSAESTTPSLGGQVVLSGRLPLSSGPLVAPPGPHSGDRRLQPAPASGRRIGGRETGLQVGEHRLAASLWGVVRGGTQVLVRQRELGNGPPGFAVLQQERACGVRQVVLVAYL